MGPHQLDQLLTSPPNLGDQPIPHAQGVAPDVVGLLSEELHRMVARQLHMAMAVARNLAVARTIAVQKSLQSKSECSTHGPVAQPDANVPDCIPNELQEVVGHHILQGSFAASDRQVIQQRRKDLWISRAGSLSYLASNHSFNVHTFFSTAEVPRFNCICRPESMSSMSDRCCIPESIEQREHSTL